jgi:hypothetical protein
MRCLHPVFNVIKLTLAPPDLIPRRHIPLPPPPELIDGKEEYILLKRFWTEYSSSIFNT